MGGVNSKLAEEYELLQEEMEMLKGENELLRSDVDLLRRVIKALPNPMDIVRLRRLLEE